MAATIDSTETERPSGIATTRPFVGELWREAAQRGDLAAFVAAAAPHVSRAFGVEHVYVRRADATCTRLETVASSATAPRLEAATTIAPSQAARLAAFFDEVDLADDATLDLVRPSGLVAPTWALALRAPRVRAVLVLVCSSSVAPNEAERLELRKVAEVFSAAIASDTRFRDLARSRDAAEADRAAFAARLERSGLVDVVASESSALRAVVDRANQVARIDVPVLILGEAGTGRELTARLVHERSSRARAAFVHLDCAAIAPESIEHALFGDGSPRRPDDSGEVARGMIERADGGTLFIDRPELLPASVQERLARVIETSTVDRGHTMTPIDVRFIAATAQDLHAMVTAGKFREDLWYRMGVFPLRLPPLRERRQDIPALVASFVQRLRGPASRVLATQTDLAVLSSYDWPGNVAELRSVVERALILGDGTRLDVEGALGRPRTAVPVEVIDEATLDSAMISHIERALQKTRGRIEGPRGAAAALNINPHTLRARMRKLGIDWARFRMGK